ncbi:MAG: MFS transporter [Candidatus Zixiibacteriota bacterium]|nr:MAG: MFS transporter [candidate division Zixibacteria bacterium]
MKKTGTNKMIMILGMMAFFCNGDNYAAAPLIVEIAKDLHLGISQAALSITAYMLPFGVFTLLFGPLSDRYGKARIINIAAFGTAIFSGLGAVANDLTSLSIIRSVNGVFAAAILPVTMSLIGDHLDGDPRKVQIALGKIFGIMFLGGASATVIGGTLAYIGSWRLVYLVYGFAELIIAFLMLKILERQHGAVSAFNLKDAYRDAFADSSLLKTVGIIFLMGFSVFGSFAYAGKFVEIRTGYNILLVGLILTFFGLATVFGGRKGGALRQKLGNKHLFLSGILACASWVFMGAWHSPVLLSLSLAGFGFGFIMIQPTLVAKAQQLMPKRRGTAMSLASFTMFTGGGIGTFLNGAILTEWGFESVFVIAGILILVAGTSATALLKRIAQSTHLVRQVEKDAETKKMVLSK